jgi:hypothetical protein
VDNEYADLLHVKLSYTKAADFSLGLEYRYMKMPLIFVEKRPSVQHISFVTRYYF